MYLKTLPLKQVFCLFCLQSSLGLLEDVWLCSSQDFLTKQRCVLVKVSWQKPFSFAMKGWIVAESAPTQEKRKLTKRCLSFIFFIPPKAPVAEPQQICSLRLACRWNHGSRKLSRFFSIYNLELFNCYHTGAVAVLIRPSGSGMIVGFGVSTVVVGFDAGSCTEFLEA
jgi:hypothetical protein